ITIILSAMLMCILFTYAIIYRHERGVRYFVWVLGCRVIYAGAVILEISASDLTSKIFFRNVEQTTLVFIVPLMVLFVFDLIGKDQWLRWRWPLIALFACWALVIWTDSYWHIVNSTQELVNGHLITTKTPYSLAFNIVCYGIIAGCIYALIRYILDSRPEIRKWGIWLLAIGSIPLLVEILKLIQPSLSPWLLPASVYSGICGIAMSWMMRRNKRRPSVPIARNAVGETLH